MAERRNKSAILMDATKRKLKIKSDYALAKALGVRPAMVSSEVRTGKRSLQLHMIAKMADILGKDPLAQIAWIELDKEKDKAIRGYWRSVLMARGWILGRKTVVKDDEPTDEEQPQ